MNRIIKRLAVASALAALLALAAGSSTASAQTIPGCTPATNLEGIVDDSGSMAGNDPENYRADLLEVLAFYNPDKTMGTVLFGSDAFVLFGPFAIGPNFGLIQSLLAAINSNGGGTDYDAGFNVANANNPSANARIFLSDGEPNSTPDSNLWKNPLIRAYVVGFGSADFTILNQIALETGGPSPFVVDTSDPTKGASQLRTVGQIINARLNCNPDPVLLERQFGKQGQTKGVGFKPVGKSAEILISWPTVGNVFKALFGSGKKGKKSSLASIAKKKKVKVKSQRGESYLALKLKGLKKGKKLKFKLRAKRLTGSETVSIAIIR